MDSDRAKHVSIEDKQTSFLKTFFSMLVGSIGIVKEKISGQENIYKSQLKMGSEIQIEKINHSKIESEINHSIENTNSQTSASHVSTELLYFKNEHEILLEAIIEKNNYNDLLTQDLHSSHDHTLFPLKYKTLKIFGIVLSVYSIYRILNTLRNLLFSDYNNVNLMLREDMLSIIDWIIRVCSLLFKTDISEIYLTVVEQYFSLLLVGSIIIINMRSFLKSIEFIYFKTLRTFQKSKRLENVYSVFLAYFVALFYITSAFFLISNLPITYRSAIARLFGDVDFSKLKFYYDTVYVVSVIVMGALEYLWYKANIE
eukprot:CAMPEP_0170532700 /NCGR_PEP_ID=MMETSP0209-20121228/74673_1 /TAXON_ID=665100 ORGANISM="Litonotus pictus, Strain P1" /NCGR_SAMPLE_ID=MMETSP0209 /ASSEMBLY_ACC=CAM_ASM_000301 /LENGTH=313 /DNA_ID=CAMNT_0010829205 /DNA_START=599 /DNA_END=1540 /DNA_ORIENTATION=-